MVRRLCRLWTIALLGACVLDPVPDQRSADLGDETPGIPQGPNHRAGQPCLACHDEFSVAGTVYAVRGESTPAVLADVLLTDVNGKTATATTNAVGNFFIPVSSWAPTYPLHARVSYEGVSAEMTAIIGRDGSCASCHANPSSRISAGPVYVAPTAAFLDGGAP